MPARTARRVAILGRRTDDPISAWAYSVRAAGSTLSSGRETLLRDLEADLRAVGTWPLYDDISLYASENAGQALISLKQRLVSTPVAAPTHTADRQYAFNGSTQYLNTAFIPSVHRRAMLPDNMRMAVYERTNVNSTGWHGAFVTSGTLSARMRPRNGANIEASLSSSTFSAANSNSQGMIAVSRAPGGTVRVIRNGAVLGTPAPTLLSGLPTLALFVGCLNNNGTANSFRAASVSLMTIGAAFTEDQEAADYAVWQAFFTALGAQV